MFSRFELLVGKDCICQLNQKHVIVFGVGGVGGYVVEALVRSGIGHITIVDNDTVSLSNLNRQIIATQDTIGKKKGSCRAKATGSCFLIADKKGGGR